MDVENKINTIRKKFNQDNFITYYYLTEEDKYVWKVDSDSEVNDNKINENEDKAIKSYELTGHDWRLIETRDGYRFFYNPYTGVSSWEVPKELKEYESEFNNVNNETTEMDEDDVAYQLQMMGMGDLSDYNNHNNDYDLPPEVLLHQNVLQFQDLLKDLQVTEMDTWDLLLPKLKEEEAFKIVDNERLCQSIFENYCKKISELPELKSDKKIEDKKMNMENYRQLVKGNTTYKSDWNVFNKKYFNDPISKKLNYKEREAIFSEHVQGLINIRKKEKEEKRKEKEKYRQEFITMLKEMKDLRYNSSWKKTKLLIENDTRYKNIKSANDCEYYFREYAAKLKKE
ncbi:hypothetical protein K502DRAFT_328709 [Neoconidiobolus thromboides FSU 785]|nr:hypothetical protein K502DRAFT_328709 [Neoconidiobolus thromboides FSU 785]